MPKREDLALRRVTSPRRARGVDRPEERDQRALDLAIGSLPQVLFRRTVLSNGGLADQQVDAGRLQCREFLERRGVRCLHAQGECRGADTLAPALLDLASRAPGLAELREDRAAHFRRIAQARVVFFALERGGRLGVVEQEIPAGHVDALEAAAAQPAGTADPLLRMLAAMPMLELGIVCRIDIDPKGQRRLSAGHVARTALVNSTTSLRR